MMAISGKAEASSIVFSSDSGVNFRSDIEKSFDVCRPVNIR